MKKKIAIFLLAIAVAANTQEVPGAAFQINQTEEQMQTPDQSMEQSLDQKTEKPTNVEIVSFEQTLTGHQMKLVFEPKDEKEADGYIIEEKISGDTDFYEVLEVTKNQKHTYTSDYFNIGEEVEYRVCAFKDTEDGNRIYGEYATTGIKVIKPDQTKILSAKAYEYDSIQVNWDLNEDADGYKIYQSEKKNGPYKLVKKVKDFSAENAIIRGLKFGKTYYYKVRAYSEVDGKTRYGFDSNVKSAKVTCAAPKKIKVTSCNSARMQISFAKVKGAESYVIARSDSKNGTYHTIKKNLKKTCYTDKNGTKAGNYYYYKVYAVAKGIKGCVSSPVKGQAKSLSVPSASLKMIQGEKRQLLAVAVPSTGLKWRSLTPKIVSVTESGWATASGYGTAKIQVEGHGLKKTVKIKITKRIDGIDVSRWQETIDWNQVAAAGKSFAMLRVWHTAESPIASKDTYFEQNYQGAKKAGLKVGCYAYSTAMNAKEVREEAKQVIKILRGRKMDYPVVLDLESNNQLALSNRQRTDFVFIFKKYIESHGYKFALYANTYWLDHYIDNERLKGVDLWVARYSAGPTTGYEYSGGGNVVMWQYTSSGSVPGINGRVDLDYCYKAY